MRTKRLSSQYLGLPLPLPTHIAGGKEAEGVWEHGVEENIWTEEGRGNGGMEETA